MIEAVARADRPPDRFPAMKINSPAPLLTLAAVVATIAVAGCGDAEIDLDSGGIDSAKAEEEIAAGYEEQVPNQDVESVVCPDEIDPEVGTEATCELTLTNGNTGEIVVKVLDEEGNIRWDVAEPSGAAG